MTLKNVGKVTKSRSSGRNG